MLIQPDNNKLFYFHLLVALVFQFDFYLTSCMFANHRYSHKLSGGAEEEFMDQKSKYTFIGTIQVIDIFLNFFKIQVLETQTLDDPVQVAYMYLTGSFLPDTIAAIPWAEVNIKYIFLRYLKLIKFNNYQTYFDNLII